MQFRLIQNGELGGHETLSLLILVAVAAIARAQLPEPAQDRLGCYWGYQLRNEWVIEPLFDQVQPFSYMDSLAIVSINGKDALIDRHGTEVLTALSITPLKKDYRTAVPRFYVVRLGDSIGLYHSRSRQFRFVFEGKDLAANTKHPSLLHLTSDWVEGPDGKPTLLRGIANLNRIIVPLQPEPLEYLEPDHLIWCRSGKYYLHDTSGQRLSSQGYDYISPTWVNHHLIYTQDSLQGFLDADGNATTLAEYRIEGFTPNESTTQRRSNHILPRGLVVYHTTTNGYNAFSQDRFLLEHDADSVYQDPRSSIPLVFTFKNRRDRWAKTTMMIEEQAVSIRRVGSIRLYPDEQILCITTDSISYFYQFSGQLLWQYPKSQNPWIYDVGDGYYIVKANDLWHYHNHRGKHQFSVDSAPEKLSNTSPSGTPTTFYLLKTHGKVGVFDSRFKEVLPQEYDAVYTGYIPKVPPGAYSRGGLHSFVEQTPFTVLVKNHQVYQLQDLLDGKNQPLTRGGNPKAPLLFIGKHGTLFISKTGEILADPKGIPTGWPDQVLDADSTYFVYDNEVFSAKAGKIIAGSAYSHPKVRLLNDSLIKVNQYLFRLDGAPVCPSFRFIEPYLDSFHFGSKTPEYLYFLDGNCQYIIKDSVLGLAEWDPVSRRCMVLQHDRFDYSKLFWRYVKVKADGNLIPLSSDSLLKPFTLNPYTYQLVYAKKGFGVIDTGLQQVLPNEFAAITLTHNDRFVVLTQKQQIGIHDLQGRQLGGYHRWDRVSPIFGDCVIFRNGSDWWLLRFNGKCESLFQKRPLDALKDIAKQVLPNFNHIEHQMAELPYQHQIFLLEELIRLILPSIEGGYHPSFPRSSPGELDIHLAFDSPLLRQNQTGVGPIPYLVKTPAMPIPTYYRIENHTGRTLTLQSLTTQRDLATGEFQTIGSPVNYHIGPSGLENISIDDVLNVAQAEPTLNQYLTEFILENQNLRVKCTREGQYFNMVKNDFVITDEGIRFYLLDYNSKTRVPVDVPKSVLNVFLKMKI